MKNQTTTVALFSGGLDSATAAGIAQKAGHRVIALSINYGQRHYREIEAAKSVAKLMGIEEHQIIDVNLSSWGGSSLTDLEQNIPKTGILKDHIPNTYVPGRNTVFIAIGLSLAEARKADQLVLGVNAMDYSGYPDCRPDYIDAYQKLTNLGSKVGREGKGIKIWAPLINLEKVDIIKEALKLEIPIDLTWSCYSGEEKACGLCDSCRIRDNALIKVGREDLCSNK